MDSLVTTEWLAGELHAPDLRILDASWFLPDAGRDAGAEFAAVHLPGAVFFDINAIADRASTLPTMLPPADQFAAQLGALGVGDGDRIVLYDNSPHHTAARGWWMLHSVGIAASILDGGLAKWVAEGRPVEAGVPTPQPATVTVTYDAARVRTLEQLRANLPTLAEQVIDARSAARFAGSEPEFRPGLASGHIPDSTNIPSSAFFNADGRWKHRSTIGALFDAAGIEIDRPVVTTCGSGITAAIPLFALHLLGQDGALYDGSWTEWGADPSTPKSRGGNEQDEG